MRLSIQKASHLCRTCVALNSELSRENVLNVEYSIWRTKIMCDRGLKFCEKLSGNGEREKADNAAVCVAICSGCIGTRIA